LSIWLSVDPMSDKYPSLSPYVYCANNPVILVDPDGRDLIIIGSKSDAASAQLQAKTEMTISKDKNGKITCSGEAKNDFDKNLIELTTKSEIDVVITAENTDRVSSGENYNGGAFMGTTLKKDDNGNVIGAVTKMEINPFKLGVMDMVCNEGKITGNSIGHEISEAYMAAKYSFKNELIIGPAISGNFTYPLYEGFHYAARPKQPCGENLDPAIFDAFETAFKIRNQYIK